MPADAPLYPVIPADDTGVAADVTGAAHLLRISLLMAGSCLPVLGAVLLAPVLPEMQDHFQGARAAEALVPLVLTIPALALALLAPFAGIIVDRLGRRRLLLVATMVYALCGTAPLWLDSLGAILASRVLVGICEAAIMTCCTTLIGDFYRGPQRIRYLSLQTMCTSASATVFFIVGGTAGSAGWRAPFWLYSVSLLIAPLMAIALPRVKRKSSSDGQVRPNAERRPFPWRQMRSTCALTFFGAMVFYTVPVEMSYLLDDLGITSSAVIGLATAVASAATVVGAIAFTRLNRRPEEVLPPVLAVCAIGFALMFLADGPLPDHRRRDQLPRHRHAAAGPADPRNVPARIRGPRARHRALDERDVRRDVRVAPGPTGRGEERGHPCRCRGRAGGSHCPGGRRAAVEAPAP